MTLYLPVTHLLLLSLVVSFLFGTALQELSGELFGFDSVAQVGADKVQHLIRGLHLLQVRHNGRHCEHKHTLTFLL